MLPYAAWELPSQWPFSQETQQRARDTKCRLSLPDAQVETPKTIKGICGSTRDLLGDYTKLSLFTWLQVYLSKGTMVQHLCKTIEICWWVVSEEKHEGSGEGFLGCRGQTVWLALFVCFLPLLYLVPSPVTCKMSWQRACSTWMGEGRLTTSNEAIKRRPKHMHPEQKGVP